MEEKNKGSISIHHRRKKKKTMNVTKKLKKKKKKKQLTNYPRKWSKLL